MIEIGQVIDLFAVCGQETIRYVDDYYIVYRSVLKLEFIGVYASIFNALHSYCGKSIRQKSPLRVDRQLMHRHILNKRSVYTHS